jgi:hypothetical protein
LTFACEWPAPDITLTRLDIDAERLHEVASRARLLWPDAGEATPGRDRTNRSST